MIASSISFIIYFCIVAMAQPFHNLKDQVIFERPITSKVKGRAFVPSDLVNLDRVGDFQVSPDGHHAVFTRWNYDISQNQASKNIWIVSLKKNHFHALTKASMGEIHSSPLWLSSGEVAFFASDSSAPEKKPQLLYVDIHSDNISPKSMTGDELKYGLSNVQYHPGADMISFTAEVYANDQSSLEDTARIDQEKQNDPSTAMVFDKIYFRHWDKYDNHKNSHIFTVPLGSDKQIDISKASNWMHGIKSLSSPIGPFGDASNFQFSADGSELVFASMAKFDESPQAWSTETHIYHVSESSKGAVKCLTCDLGVGAKNNPSFSPNGRYIAWTQMERAQFEADKTNLIILDRKNSGKVTVLTKDLDRSVGSYVWSTDSEEIYFIVDDSGRSRLFSTGVDYGDKPIELLEESHISALSTVPGSKNLILGVASMMAPTEFYSFNIKAKELMKLTEVNTNYLKQISVSKPEIFWFEGDGNDKVMGWLLKPYNFQPNKKYPLAFLIHGGPQSAWVDNFSTRWNPQVFAGAGYAVVMINFHGSTGYGQNFTDSISGHWGGAPFNDLMKGLDHVLEKYSFIDSNRIAGLGASYGGYMINWINGHSERFKCLVNHDGLFDVKTMYYTTEELYFTEYEFKGAPFENRELYDKWNPSEFVHNWKTPTLVIHGGTDYRVPQGEGFATFTALQRQGIESRLVFFPDENHWVLKPANSLRWHKEVLGWINHYTQRMN